MRDDSLADRKLHFVPTVRLGDLLTVVAFLLAGTVAWSKNDARVGRLEEIAARQETTNSRIEQSVDKARGELREDIKEVSNTVRRLESRANRGG